MTVVHPAGHAGDWTLVLNEQWDDFDERRWGVGHITAEKNVPDDDAQWSTNHVIVEDNHCTLQIESKGTGPDGCYQGAINCSVGGETWMPHDGIPIEPGMFVEARLKLPGRKGILPGFWAMPAYRSWPPEIDCLELLQDGTDEEERSTIWTNVHWTATGEPDTVDEFGVGDHRHELLPLKKTTDLTEEFHTYGFAWFEDAIRWYFDDYEHRTSIIEGAKFDTLNDERIHPFGLVFSNHVNRYGAAELDQTWVEELVIDWVRVWNHDRNTSDPDSHGLLDDFKSGSLGRWETDGAWECTPDLSVTGEYAAGHNGQYEGLEQYSVDFYRTYAPLQFWFYLEATQSLDFGWVYRWNDGAPDNYTVAIRPDRLTLRVEEAGEIAVLDTNEEWDLPTETWCRILVDFGYTTENELYVEVEYPQCEEPYTVTATDMTHDSGGHWYVAPATDTDRYLYVDEFSRRTAY